MIVMGIDPSLTRTGVVILSEGKVRQALALPNRKDLETIPRVLDIAGVTKGLIINFKPTLVVIEGFSYGSKGRSVYDIAYLGWRIREELERLKSIDNIPWIEIPPSQLKKFATGKGNANKEIILQQVYKHWGYETHDNNLADAYVLAKIGEAYLNVKNGNEPKLTKFQHEVIGQLIGVKEGK